MGGKFPGRARSADDWTTAAWEKLEQLRGQFDSRMGSRMAPGDVRAAVLALLAEGPMHGYQIIREIEQRSGGSRDGSRTGALPKAGLSLAQATGQVARAGSPEQVTQAVAVLDEARRKIYAILAQE
jgi:hypothetical protein